MYGCVYDSVCACVFWNRPCRIIFSEALDSSFLPFDLHLSVWDLWDDGWWAQKVLSGPGWKDLAVIVEWTSVLYPVGATKGFEVGG